MINRKNMFLIAALFCVLLIVQVSASENIDVNNIGGIVKKITALGTKYGVENVIVTFDIDCTLLTQADNFGSDIWYDWQSDLFKNKKDSPFLVSKEFGKMLFYQRMIQSFTKCYPTEENFPEVVKKLQKDGFTVIALTARGPEGRDLTEAQLNACEFNFNDNSLSEGFPGEYLPYKLDDPKKYGITGEEVTNFNLQPPRAVSFFNGIMMVSGQNKGIMLKTLLHKTGKTFRAIVLVDDGKKNTDNMYSVYKASDVDVNTYRYSYDDALKRQFKQSNKNNVIKQWKEYKASIDSIFGK
jgi:hypothetical protein